MHDRRVIPPAKLKTQFGRGVLGYLPGYIHGYLPGEGYVLGSLLSLEVVVGKLVMVSHDPQDVVYGHIPMLGLAEYILELVLGYLQGYLFADQLRIGHELGQGSLEIPDVGGDVFGYDVHDIVGDPDASGLDLFLEDGRPGLEVGGLEIHIESSLETAS